MQGEEGRRRSSGNGKNTIKFFKKLFKEKKATNFQAQHFPITVVTIAIETAKSSFPKLKIKNIANLSG